MKRIMIWTLVVVIAVVVVVVGVGALLPVAHVATVRAEYDAPPERIFEIISDIPAQPEWRPSVERIEELEPRDGRPAWREVGKTGALPMELTESEPPRRMVTTILSEGMPFGGRWIFEVEPTTDGTALTITEEGEVYNPVFRFVSRFIMGHHGTATAYLRDLGGRLGQDVEVAVIR